MFYYAQSIYRCDFKDPGQNVHKRCNNLIPIYYMVYNLKCTHHNIIITRAYTRRGVTPLLFIVLQTPCVQDLLLLLQVYATKIMCVQQSRWIMK